MRISFLLITEQYVFTFSTLMSQTELTYSFDIHLKNEVTIFEIVTHVFMNCFIQKWLNINFWSIRFMLLVSSIYVFMLYLQMNLFLEKKKQGQKKSKILVNTCKC